MEFEKVYPVTDKLHTATDEELEQLETRLGMPSSFHYPRIARSFN